MIRGMPWLFASADSRAISSSVSTLPVGLVGREAQIAAMSGVTSRWSKSTRYLNSCGPVFSINGRHGAEQAPSMPLVGVADVFRDQRQQDFPARAVRHPPGEQIEQEKKRGLAAGVMAMFSGPISQPKVFRKSAAMAARNRGLPRGGS